MIYDIYIKRILDIVASLMAILVLFPFILFFSILLTFVNGGKPFFLQRRPGKNEAIFTIYKFKTMNDKKDEFGNLLPDVQRTTKVGAFIRKASLDELLQLFNVLKGDMSIVGPRPLLIEYLPRYNEDQAKRHLVKPGITGWAQVNGRNAISWPQKFKLDTYYVENQSFLLDLKIIFLTIKKVLVREGVNAQSDVTMEPFLGNN